jgi:hypothetical protein
MPFLQITDHLVIMLQNVRQQQLQQQQQLWQHPPSADQFSEPAVRVASCQRIPGVRWLLPAAYNLREG